MVDFVFDACSLIYLTKVGVKEKISKLGCRVLVSPTVKKELIAEPEKYPDAMILEKNAQKGIIQEVPVELHNVPPHRSLGRGEHETIAICTSKGGIPITDDLLAIHYAISHGLKPKTSEIILLELLEKKIITGDEFKTSFQKLCNLKALNLEIMTLINEKAKKLWKNQDAGKK